MMTIPVILLNYNSTDDCRKCISYLQNQTGVDIEIIVVDNCSAEENRVSIEKLCQEVKCTFIANTRNVGYNAGNNIGLRYAVEKGYEYALIANPDMEFPQTNYIDKLTRIIQSDTKIALVASDIVTFKGIHQNPMKPDGNWKSSFGCLTGLFKKEPKDTYTFIDNWQENHICSKVSGCCFMIRLSFLKEIGFFDEKVFLYCEESILSKQVEHAGMKMFYTAESQAIHNHQSSEKGNPASRFRVWRDSRIYFIKNYSKDSMFGKTIAILNMYFYTQMMILCLTFKKKSAHAQ